MKRPRTGGAQAVFRPRFVRVSSVGQYANDSGRSSRSLGRGFRGKRPRMGVARAFFAPRIVRVSRAGQYANDFRPIIRSCIKCDAVRERILDLESWPGGKRGPCWRLSSVELRGLFAQELGEMYDSGSQGQKRGLSGHETGVLYDSAGPRGSVFRGRRALRPFHASARRRNPRSGTCWHFGVKTKEQEIILP